MPQDSVPEPRFCIFVALVPVQDPVYRYKEADFAQFELQGCFCVCGSLISAPTSLGPFFELSTAGKGRAPLPFNPFGFDPILAWILMVFPSLLSLGAISTIFEAWSLGLEFD